MISIFPLLKWEQSFAYPPIKGEPLIPQNYFICVAVVMSMNTSLLHLLEAETWLNPHLADFYENMVLVPI